jgi:23S rRNA pseudouridine2605 synthase
MQQRLQKVIAQAGITSRRKAEDLILEGKVKVNGKLIKELGFKVSSSDTIEVNEIPLIKEEKVYFVMYKPTGVISAVSDDKGRKVVTDFFTDVKERIFPIGRLDYDTSGVLLITNDGDFSNLLMHPKHEIDKQYIAKVEGMLTKQEVNQLEKGIKLVDGITAPAKAKVISFDRKKQTTIVQLTIHEGRNRQVRRMFEAIGHKVKKLKREKIGFLGVEGLRPGEYRVLSIHEVKRLRALAQTNDWRLKY